MRLSVGSSLGLVSDDDIAEGEHLVDLSLEELGDERSREVHGEGLAKETNNANEEVRLGSIILSSLLDFDYNVRARGENSVRTFPDSEAVLASSRADSIPWVRKNPPR